MSCSLLKERLNKQQSLWQGKDELTALKAVIVNCLIASQQKELMDANARKTINKE